MENLKLGCYYRINGTKRILYWDGEKFMKPVKDSRGSYKSGWLSHLEKQPNVKRTEIVEESDLY